MGKICDINLNDQGLLWACTPVHLPEPGKRVSLADDAMGLFSAFLPWEGLCMCDIISLIITKEESSWQWIKDNGYKKGTHFCKDQEYSYL